uniref:G-protein coupled receptors family 1 profile domain-containing protein n=1 Tax=Mycena chlorophos TaxID=658473 RepID=A0ABQ0L7Y3_MYCCL|nr:predicted protein [Mycena chlorophos]
MTPDEAATLQGIGRDWYQGFIAITNETFLLTIYAGLMLQAASILLSRQGRRVRSYIMSMGGLTLLFLMAIAMWSIDLATFIIEPKFMLVLNPDEDFETKVNNTYDSLDKLYIAQNAVYAWMPFIGDAIIVHRVWQLREFLGFVWLIAIPVLCLIGTFVGTIMLSWCTATATEAEIENGSFISPPLCANAQMVTYVLPAVATAVATILIAMTARTHHRRVSPIHFNSEGRKTRTRVERVFLILVETGFFYFLFFLIQILGDLNAVENLINNNTTLYVLMNMFDYSSSVIVGAYPTLIIVLAHSKRTTLATDVHSVSHGDSTLRSGTNISGTLRTGTSQSQSFSKGTYPLDLNPASSVGNLNASQEVFALEPGDVEMGGMSGSRRKIERI